MAPSGRRSLDQANRLELQSRPYWQPVNRIHHRHLLSLLSPRACVDISYTCVIKYFNAAKSLFYCAILSRSCNQFLHILLSHQNPSLEPVLVATNRIRPKCNLNYICCSIKCCITCIIPVFVLKILHDN